MSAGVTDRPTGFGQMRHRIRSNRAAWRAERFARYCRSRWPGHTEQHVAAFARLPVTTARKHLTGECRPGADALLAYVAVFGPDLLSTLLPEADWVARAADDERRREIQRDLGFIARGGS